MYVEGINGILTKKNITSIFLQCICISRLTNMRNHKDILNPENLHYIKTQEKLLF